MKKNCGMSVEGRNNNKKDKTDNMKTSSASFSQSKRNTRQEHPTSSRTKNSGRQHIPSSYIRVPAPSVACMENGGGSLSSAQPKARRRDKKCPLTISSVLSKGVDKISLMEGPLPRLQILPDDQHDTDDAKGPDNSKNVKSVTTGGLRFASEDSGNDAAEIETTTANVGKSGGLRFGNENSMTPTPTFQERNSSVVSDASMTDDSPETGCNRKPQGRTVARNTMGFASYMKSVARCSQDVLCSEDCGYGTGCQAQCRDLHGIPPESLTSSLTVPSLGLTGPGGTNPFPGSGGPVPYPGSGGTVAYSGLQARPGAPPVGYGEQQGGYPDHPDGRYRPMDCPDSCPGPSDNSGQLNFYIMLLLEIFGVLIFFAICTITFWLTLAYHFVKLLVELKNADRNTQVAVAIVFGLLLLAFAICHVTSGSSSCSRSSGGSRLSWNKGGSCGRYRAKPKPRTSIIVKLLSQMRKMLFSSSSKTQSTPCAAKSTPSAAKGAPFAAKKAQYRRKTRYSDCEGRAIFINSRRYAIPTEMKQPPTVLIWLLEMLGRYV